MFTKISEFAARHSVKIAFVAGAAVAVALEKAYVFGKGKYDDRKCKKESEKKAESEKSKEAPNAA